MAAARESRWRAGRRAVLHTLFVAVPLIFDTSVTPVFALPKFTVVALGAFVVAALGAAQHWARDPRPSWRNDLAVPVLILLSWTAVTAAASPSPRMSILGSRESLNGLATAIAFVVVFFATAEAFDWPGVRRALSVLWFGGGGVVLLYAGVQLHDRLLAWGGQWDPIAWMNPPGEGAIWSTLGNPNDLAGFLAIILPIGVVLLVLARNPLIRWITSVMLALLLIEMVVTTSRGALAGAVVAITVLAVWFRDEIRTQARLVLVRAGAVVAVVMGIAILVIASGRTERGIADLVDTGEGTTAALRVELWRTAWRMAEDNAVLGVGPDGFGRSFDAFRSKRFLRVYGPQPLATDAHNLFLTYMATLGFPGVLLFGFLVACAVRILVKSGHGRPIQTRATPSPSPRDDERALVAAVLAALVAYLVQASFNRQDIALDFCFWVLLGLACTFNRERRQLAA